MVLQSEIFSRKDSGRIVDGDWDVNVTPLEDFPKYKICYERFVNGKTWDQAGAYDLMDELMKIKPGADRCYSSSDVKVRYDALDEVYRKVKTQNELMSRKEIHKYNFRESGGVYVHIDRNSNFIFARGGCHRLAISKILKLKIIPAQVGVVHYKALPFWRNCVIKAPDKKII
ncbi:hypothetical protein [Alkalispirochaeta americana]|uniref:hypothetical protein n=1 Tax=Alkalispirochaeta americana TaxID=159291 RepID=UPI001179FDF9|nr:hypothetical protein [Alkalispirochaeta americana]